MKNDLYYFIDFQLDFFFLIQNINKLDQLDFV